VGRLDRTYQLMMSTSAALGVCLHSIVIGSQAAQMQVGASRGIAGHAVPPLVGYKRLKLDDSEASTFLLLDPRNIIETHGSTELVLGAAHKEPANPLLTEHECVLRWLFWSVHGATRLLTRRGKGAAARLGGPEGDQPSWSSA
jgi:hypothetical protein